MIISKLHNGLEVLSAVAYQEPYSRLIIRYKYRHEQYQLDHIATIMFDAFHPRVFSGYEYLTYVPLSDKDRYYIGFDKNELVAKELARFYGLELIPTLYKYDCKHQSDLHSVEDRFANVKFAYEARTKLLPSNVVLYDDVLTTGATMEVCSNRLLQAGVQDVKCITFAKAYSRKE